MKLTQGMKISGKINGTSFIGKVQKEGTTVYICQNVENGDDCIDKLGYDYSWNVGDGTESRCELIGVTDIKLLNSSTYKDFVEGDVLQSADGDSIRTVIFNHKTLVVLMDEDGDATSNYTREELFNDGWRLVVTQPAEEMIEMTLEEVAKLRGISVDKLRIKD